MVGEKVYGPMDFTTNDEIGIQISGFDIQPSLLENRHQPYFQERVEGAGFSKAMDLLMWHLEMGKLAEDSEFHPAIMESAQQSLDEHGITIRNMRKSDLANEMGRFHEVYNNEAWGDNWGLRPDHPRGSRVSRQDAQDGDRRGLGNDRRKPPTGRPSAPLTLPDFNQVLAKMNGGSSRSAGTTS